jgi:uncharacterized protein YjdB
MERTAMTDHSFSGQKSNAPGIPGKERNITLRISSAGDRVRVGDTLQLRVQNETGADITKEATYRTKDKHVSVSGSGLITAIAAGSFRIEIEDAAGGTAIFEGQCFL